MAGRPPSNQQNWIEVQDYKFDVADDVEKSLARYLLQAPNGTVRTRMKALMLDGFKAHREALGKPVADVEAGSQTRRRKTQISRFYFDRGDAVERACYDFLRLAQPGKRKGRVVKLLKLGYEYKQRLKAGGQVTQKGEL